MKKNLVVLSLVALLGISLPAMAHPAGGPHGGPRPHQVHHCPPPHHGPHAYRHGGFGMSFGYCPRPICPPPIFYNYSIGTPYYYGAYPPGYYGPDLYLNFRL